MWEQEEGGATDLPESNPAKESAGNNRHTRHESASFQSTRIPR
jgi:hypothetical protein